MKKITEKEIQVILQLLQKYNVGIQEKTNYKIKEIDTDFFDEK